MHSVTCPYCDADVSMDEVEKEGGCCPECGMVLGGSVLMSEEDDDFDDFDDDDDEFEEAD